MGGAYTEMVILQTIRPKRCLAKGAAVLLLLGLPCPVAADEPTLPPSPPAYGWPPCLLSLLQYPFLRMVGSPVIGWEGEFTYSSYLVQ